MTLRDRYVQAIKRRGFTEQESRSRKYRVFNKPGTVNFYLGKNGALRVGSTVADSRPVTESYKQLILNTKGDQSK